MKPRVVHTHPKLLVNLKLANHEWNLKFTAMRVNPTFIGRTMIGLQYFIKSTTLKCSLAKKYLCERDTFQ